MNVIDWLTPWELSPTLLLMFFVGGWLFVRGTRVHRVGGVRQAFFWIGMIVLYLSMHTRIDYYAERMFFIHRLQHLALHHLGPLLIMGAYPGQVMRAGLPMSWRLRLRDFRLSKPGRILIAVLTNKILVPVLFVVLVLGFLIPTVQFYSSCTGTSSWIAVQVRRQYCRQVGALFPRSLLWSRKWLWAPSLRLLNTISIPSLTCAAGQYQA